MATEPKKPTPAAEIKQLKALIIEMSANHEKEIAKTANENYTLGLTQGLAEADAAHQAQSYITRLFKR